MLLFVLNRSKKVTPTLEQMNPASDFIQTLNASPDPGVPYTILAGDVDAYTRTDRSVLRRAARQGWARASCSTRCSARRPTTSR